MTYHFAAISVLKYMLIVLSLFCRWLLTPFKNNGHLTVGQIHYNAKHSGTRQVIERAFGLLKGRWKRLKCIDMEDIEEISYVVTAACVPHNFCLFADQGDIAVSWWGWGWWWWFGQWSTWPAYAPGYAKRNLMVQYLNNILLKMSVFQTRDCFSYQGTLSDSLAALGSLLLNSKTNKSNK